MSSQRIKKGTARIGKEYEISQSNVASDELSQILANYHNSVFSFEYKMFHCLNCNELW